MALVTITLKTKNGLDVGNHQLDLAEFPDIMMETDKAYVLKRVLPRKEGAYYYEASVHTLEEPA